MFSILARFPHFVPLFLHYHIINFLQAEIKSPNSEEVKLELTKIFHLYVHIDHTLLLQYYQSMLELTGPLESKIVDPTLEILQDQLDSKDNQELIHAFQHVISACTSLIQISKVLSKLILQMSTQDFMPRIGSEILTQTLKLSTNQESIQLECIRNLITLCSITKSNYQFIRALNASTIIAMLNLSPCISIPAFQLLQSLLGTGNRYILHYMHFNYAPMLMQDQDNELIFNLNCQLVRQTYSHKQLELYIQIGFIDKILDEVSSLAPNSLVMAMMALIKLLRFSKLVDNEVVCRKIRPYTKYWDLRVRKLASFACNL